MEPLTAPQILVVDDDIESLALIQRIIEGAGYTVVGVAQDGQEAIELTKALHPNIVLLDLTMPVMDGLSALRRIRSLDSRVAIIIVSAHEDPKLLRKAMMGGANGYLTKLQLNKHLAASIAAVLTGDFAAADPALIRLAFESPSNGSISKPDPNATKLLKSLSPREQSVLLLVAKGYDNQEIADELVISYHTVKSHISRIFNKLDVADRTQAAVLALRAGLPDSG